MSRNKAIVFALLVVAVVGIVLFLKIPRASTPKLYSRDGSQVAARYFENDEAGFAITYPAEWGKVHEDAAVSVFSNKKNVTIGTHGYRGDLDLSKQCPKAYDIRVQTYNDIAGKGYCRLFQRGENYMYYVARVGKLSDEASQLHLIEYVWVNTKTGGVEFVYYHDEAQPLVDTKLAESVLASFADGTLSPESLAAHQAFEAMILSLELK